MKKLSCRAYIRKHDDRLWLICVEPPPQANEAELILCACPDEEVSQTILDGINNALTLYRKGDWELVKGILEQIGEAQIKHRTCRQVPPEALH